MINVGYSNKIFERRVNQYFIQNLAFSSITLRPEINLLPDGALIGLIGHRNLSFVSLNNKFNQIYRI